MLPPPPATPSLATIVTAAGAALAHVGRFDDVVEVVERAAKDVAVAMDHALDGAEGTSWSSWSDAAPSSANLLALLAAAGGAVLLLVGGWQLCLHALGERFGGRTAVDRGRMLQCEEGAEDGAQSYLYKADDLYYDRERYGNRDFDGSRASLLPGTRDEDPHGREARDGDGMPGEAGEATSLLQYGEPGLGTRCGCSQSRADVSADLLAVLRASRSVADVTRPQGMTSGLAAAPAGYPLPAANVSERLRAEHRTMDRGRLFAPSEV